MAPGESRQGIGAGGGHQDQIGPSRQFDMAHGRLGGLVPKTAAHRMPGQRLQGGRGHETFGSGRHHHAYLGPGFAQTAHKFGAFIGGDATGNAQQNTLSV